MNKYRVYAYILWVRICWCRGRKQNREIPEGTIKQEKDWNAMLIDVHAHLLTEGMFNRHEFWGPFMKVQGLTVGHFALGTKQPAKASSDEEAQANLLARMSHESRRKLMAERGVDKLVMSTPSHCFMYWAGDFANEYARVCNDELSAFCRKDPDHFDFWCHANLADPEAAAK